MTDTERKSYREAITAYSDRQSRRVLFPKAALIDMDGVLYDSMKYHTLAWQRMISELGINCTRNEFYIYEGMTGPATINLIFNREYGRDATEEEIRELYARKSRYFIEMGRKEPMPGADRMLHTLANAGINRVLVTGSAQNSLISSLNEDYPGMFHDNLRVTALDVTNGKPHPEPYLKGLSKARATAEETIVIENAPLGVKSGSAAGCFTISITTGPIPFEDMRNAGADLIFSSMPEFADKLPALLETFQELDDSR